MKTRCHRVLGVVILLLLGVLAARTVTVRAAWIVPQESPERSCSMASNTTESPADLDALGRSLREQLRPAPCAADDPRARSREPVRFDSSWAFALSTGTTMAVAVVIRSFLAEARFSHIQVMPS